MQTTSRPSKIFVLNFHNRLNQRPEKISEALPHFYLLMEDLVQDYFAYLDINRTYWLIQNLEEEIDSLVEPSPDYPEGETEKIALTKIRQRFYEDKIIQEVKDLYLTERMPKEPLINVPVLDKRKLSTFVSMNFPVTSRSQNNNPHGSTAASWVGNLTTLKRNSANHEIIALRSTSLTAKEFTAKEFTAKEFNMSLEKQPQTQRGGGGGGFEEMKNKVMVQFTSMKTLPKESEKLREELDRLFNIMQEEWMNNKQDTAFSYLIRIRRFPQAEKLHDDDYEYYKRKLRENKGLIIELDKINYK